jgi:hypothetical protein
MDWLAAAIAATIGAVLAWATKTYRERRYRRLEAENQTLKQREKANDEAARLYRDHGRVGDGLPIRVLDGIRYRKVEPQ